MQGTDKLWRDDVDPTADLDIGREIIDYKDVKTRIRMMAKPRLGEDTSVRQEVSGNDRAAGRSESLHQGISQLLFLRATKPRLMPSPTA